MNRKYLLHADKIDDRDKILSIQAPETLPEKIDLSGYMPPIFDQQTLGSCSAQAISAALQFDAIKNMQPDAGIVRSRLFIYYCEREIEGTILTDSGASLRDGLQSVHVQGACNESLWAYDPAKFAVKPPEDCYTDGLLYRSISYARVLQDPQELKKTLASGYPIIFGIQVFASFERQSVSTTGLVPMPLPQEQLLGGHALVLVGYDDQKQLFKFRNSWGENWGDHGYGFLPYQYVLSQNLASSFWIITSTM